MNSIHLSEEMNRHGNPNKPRLHRKMTVNWSALAEDDDEFFDSRERISNVIALDLAAPSGSSPHGDEFDDSRMSFASAVSPDDFRCLSGGRASISGGRASTSLNFVPDYNVWMAEPGPITERRKRLFHGMGFSNKDFFQRSSIDYKGVFSKKTGKGDAGRVGKGSGNEFDGSLSDGEIDDPVLDKRKEDFFGPVSKQRVTRTSTILTGPCASPSGKVSSNRSDPSDDEVGAFYMITNLDTGKEFVVNERDNKGMWNRLSDLHTGKQLTMEEFEKSAGYSPVVKELMRRLRMKDNRKLLGSSSTVSKSLRSSKRHGSNLLKNITRSVSTSMSGLKGDREREGLPATPHRVHEPKPRVGPEWVRVRGHGKSYKELSALQLCQEIQAHEGSIWTIRFSLDAHYLASAGEDRVIHVWEVQECDVVSTGQPEEWTLTPLHPSAAGAMSPDRQFSGSEIALGPSFELKKKGKGSLSRKKGMPDYVYVPETVFGLSERPVCSFQGHLDDVLDLSWSKSQQLLSSSMDKTVRLWDLESGSCLKSFVHSDYVTCIQFNPVDEDYFISGSLDAKVRIWSVPNHKVVDWSDLHEMITAVCYTPDGEGAIIGTHKGGIRVFNAENCKLEQTNKLDLQNKKKNSKKKITGFQFSPLNPSDVIVTSADSRIRLLEGSTPAYKFKGFKNTCSQIAASFTPDGNYIVSASEDSQVFVWKREKMPRNGSTVGKSKPNKVTSCESFACKDVAMAIPWPGTIRSETPPPLAKGNSKRHSRRPSGGQPLQSNTGSPSKDENENLGGGIKESSKKKRPPLPKKANGKEKEKGSKGSMEEVRLTRRDSATGVGESFSSASGRFGGESPSISSEPNSASASWGELDGNGRQGVATAWGMVIVTAGLGGEIRAYQNFGLPRRVGLGRQANLFNVLRNQLLATKCLCCVMATPPATLSRNG